MTTSSDLYAFDITVHRLAASPHPDGHSPVVHEDAWGAWPTLTVSRELLNMPLAIAFDDALEQLGRLERMFVEQDGSFVWTGRRLDRPWQVDGNAVEIAGRLLLADLKGSCPPDEFDRLLSCLGWPGERLMMLLVRPGVLLAEDTFRLHALARGKAGVGRAVPPG
jgi:hypothetical protein